MKAEFTQIVVDGMKDVLTVNQLEQLANIVNNTLEKFDVKPMETDMEQQKRANTELLEAFISAKKIEGCSDKTIHYYKTTIEKLISATNKMVQEVSTNDIR